MSTTVADLLAVLRADTSGFDGPISQSAATANQLGSTVGSSGGALASFGDLLGTVGGIAAGAFVSGLTAALSTGIAFGSMIDNAKVSLQGFGESSTQAANNIKGVVELSNSLGQVQPQMLKASETLQILTGGAENNAKTLTALAGAAATTQVPVQQLTQQIGYLYQAFSQGDTSIGFMGRVLVREGLIPQSTLDQAVALAKAGTDINTIWALVMSTMAGGSAAAQQYSGTLSGLTNSVKGLLSSDMGTAFAPVYDGIKQVAQALKDLLSSPAVTDFAKQIGGDLGNVLPKFTDLAKSIESLSKDAGSLTGLVSSFKELVPLLGVIGGMAVGSGVGILGDLPLIGAALGPLTSLLGPVTLGLAGFLATSAQTRDAVINLASAVGNLFMSLSPIVGAAAGLVGALQPIAADVINITAAIVNFVANTKQLLDSLMLLGAAYIAFSVWEKAVAIFESVGVWMKAFVVDANEVAAAEQLQVVAGEELSAALNGVALAQERLTLVQEQNQAAMIATSDYWLTAKVNAESLALAEGQLTAAQTGLNVAMETGVAADAAAGEAMAGVGFSLSGLLGPIGLAVAAFAGLNAIIPKSWLGGNDLFNTMVLGLKTVADAAIFVTPFLGTYVEHMKQADAVNRTVADSLKQFQGKVDTSSFDAITKAADASTLALKNYQAGMQLINSGQVDVVPGGKQINQKEIDQISPLAAKQAADAQNAANIMTNALNVTGASMKQVQDQAKALHIDLTQSLDTQAGQDNMAKLVTSLQQIAPAASQASSNLKILTADMTSLIADIQGKPGNDTFTITKDEVDKLGAAIKTLSAVGADVTNLTNAFNGMSAAVGVTYQSVQAAKDALKDFDQIAKWAQLNDALAKSLDSVAKAADAVARAQVTLADAQDKAKDATNTQAAAMAFLQQALQGHTDQYWNLVQTLDQLTPSQAAYGAEIQAEVIALQNLKNQYDALNHTYTDQQNQLTQLTDLQKQYQDILNKPLQGTSAYDQQIHANQMAQDQIKSQIDTLELMGTPTKSPTIVNLTNQLDRLRVVGDQLNLQKALDIGDKNFQLQQLANTSKEITFDQARTAAQNLGALKGQMDQLQASMDIEKPTLDALKAKTDILSTSVSQQVSALQALGSANDQVTQTQNAVKNATDQLFNTNASYRQSLDAVQKAHMAITRQELQDNVDRTNSILQYVQASKVALADLASYQSQITQSQIGSQQFANSGYTNNQLKGVEQNYGNNINGIYTSIRDMTSEMIYTAGGAGFNTQGLNSSEAFGAVAKSLAGQGFDVSYWTGVVDKLEATARYMTAGSPGYAEGGLITSPTFFAGEGYMNELMIPLTDSTRAINLLRTHAPAITAQAAGSASPLSAPPSIGSSGGHGPSSITIANGAIQVSIAIPGGMSIPPELSHEISSSITTALSEIFTAYSVSR